VRDVLESNNFQGEIVAKTHDNASNMVNAFAQWSEEFDPLPGVSIRCNAHILNLAVNKDCRLARVFD